MTKIVFRHLSNGMGGPQTAGIFPKHIFNYQLSACQCVGLNDIRRENVSAMEAS